MTLQLRFVAVFALVFGMFSAQADLPPPVKLSPAQVKKLEAHGAFANERIDAVTDNSVYSRTLMEVQCSGERDTAENGQIAVRSRSCQIVQ